MKLLTNIINIIRKKQINEISNELVMDMNDIVKFICVKTEIPIEIVLKVLDTENNWLHENGFYEDK